MIKNKSILIKNIFYMLSYAYQPLQKSNYKQIATEEFENVHDLFAAILAKGIAEQLKKGLYKKYSEVTEDSSVLRGKLELHGTMGHKLHNRQLLACLHDEFSENNIFNKILKSTATALVAHPNVNRIRKIELKRVIPFFSSTDEINLKTVSWRALNFDKNNQTYKMLMSICYFVAHSLLNTDENGKFKMADFLNDQQQMSKLYEKFILEFYRYHFKNLIVKSTKIYWDVDDGATEFLPDMLTDITLQCGDRTLIIDAKYYTAAWQYNRFDSISVRSGNMYQIYSYVKNFDRHHTGKVSGMILYAKTDEIIQPDKNYSISGNKISVKSLDLSQDFSVIAEQLKSFVRDYLYA